MNGEVLELIRVILEERDEDFCFLFNLEFVRFDLLADSFHQDGSMGPRFFVKTSDIMLKFVIEFFKFVVDIPIRLGLISEFFLFLFRERGFIFIGTQFNL